MEINADELEPVVETSAIEGFLKGQRVIMYRRAVRRADIGAYTAYEDKSQNDPNKEWLYASIYRWATDEEMNLEGLEGDTLLVTAIMSSNQLAPYIDITEKP